MCVRVVRERLEMPSFGLARRLVAEGLGTAFLLAIVIGSGIMGERLSGGNVALALLGNTLATGAGLVVLIGVFGPASGAHFNPAVTLAMLMRRAITPKSAAAYVAVQVLAAILGVWAAHLMFGEPVLQVSRKLRLSRRRVKLKLQPSSRRPKPINSSTMQLSLRWSSRSSPR